MIYYGGIDPFFSSGALAMRVADLVVCFFAVLGHNTSDILVLRHKTTGFLVDVYTFTHRHDVNYSNQMICAVDSELKNAQVDMFFQTFDGADEDVVLARAAFKKKYSKMRDQMKTCTLGIIDGLTPHGLSPHFGGKPSRGRITPKAIHGSTAEVGLRQKVRADSLATLRSSFQEGHLRKSLFPLTDPPVR